MTKMPRPTRWMKLREVSNRLGVSSQTVINQLEARTIPGGDVLFVDARGRRHFRVERAAFEAHLAAMQQHAVDSRPPHTPVVYFIQQEGAPDSPIKIGTSTIATLRQRVDTLQTSNPRRLHVLATLAGDHKRERQLHRRFASSRLHGEWFEPSDELRQLIREAAEPAPAKSAV